MTETPTTPEGDNALRTAKTKDALDWYVDYDCEPAIAGNAFERGFNAGRSQALEEAARIAETEESPFHAVPDTEVFWLSREYIARFIRAAAIKNEGAK